MAPHVTALPSPCTFDSPNLPSVVVGQSGDAFRGPGSNTFGISASFTQGKKNYSEGTKDRGSLPTQVVPMNIVLALR